MDTSKTQPASSYTTVSSNLEVAPITSTITNDDNNVNNNNHNNATRRQKRMNQNSDKNIDPLASWTDTNQNDTKHQQQWHLKTYTVGEDNGRLAAAAKELGLLKSRQPRRQVRQSQQSQSQSHRLYHRNNSNHRRRGSSTNIVSNVWHLLLETTTEDARMLAVYSAHNTNVKYDNPTMPSPFLQTQPGKQQRRRSSKRGPFSIESNDSIVDDNRYLLPEYDIRHRRPDNRKLYNENRLLSKETTITSKDDSFFIKEEEGDDESDDIDSYDNGGGGAAGIVEVDGDDDVGDGEEMIDGNGDLTSAMLATIRGMVGPAILYLPHGFANAGYMIAIPLLFVCTFFFLYSSQCLLDSWQYEHNKYNNNTNNNNNSNVANHNDALRGGEKTEEVQEIEQEHGGNSLNNENCERSPLIGSLNPTVSTIQIQHQEEQTNVMKNTNGASPTSDMLSYPELAYRALGTVGETIVKVGIACMQSGVCLTYLIFVPYNLHTSVLYVFQTNIQPIYWLVLMIAIQIPLSFIRDIRKLTPTNLLANILVLYGLLICLGYAIVKTISSDSSTLSNSSAMTTDPMDGNDLSSGSNYYNQGVFHNIWNKFTHLTPYAPNWILFIGTSVFLFEGSITLLVPLQESVVAVIEDPTIITEEEYHLMKQPELMFPLVYNRTILCIITFYTIFGIFCWMAYGDSVNTVLTTSLPIGGLATSVQLAYSIAVMLTFPLQNFPALEIITRSILAWASNYRSCSVPTLCNNKWISGSYSELSKERRKQRHRNIISSCTVLLLALVAVFTMESLDKVVSLMGSLFGCPIAYVIPPMIHTRLVLNQQEHSGTEKERSYRRYRLYCNYLAIAFGLIAMIMASITTLLTWK